MHPPVAGGLCLSCHEPHKTKEDKLIMSKVPELCFVYHDNSDFKGKIGHYPVKEDMCTTCHLPHQSNLFFIWANYL